MGGRTGARVGGGALPRRRRVALIVETSNAYARGLLDGVADWVREHRPWSIYLPEQRRGDRPPEWLRCWDGDGVLARIENDAIAACVRSSRIPAVDLSAARLVPELPWVETDDEAIARLAFEHLTERGFESFGFCADRAFNWSRWRRDAFRALVEDAGFRFEQYEVDSRAGESAGWDSRQAGLADWIRGLRRPTGVFACYDILAQQVLDACRRTDAAVPEEIAVLGVDDDAVLCRLAEPPLSSVIPDPHRTGYEAAGLLERMMDGEAVPGEAHRIPPRGVRARQSTDVLAIDDGAVVDALRFIREHICDGIGVRDVIERSPLSRRVLDSRFRRAVGRTLHDELVRARLTRVKVLLSETDLPIARVAESTGYAHVEYLSAQFARVVGEPPSRYRARTRR